MCGEPYLDRWQIGFSSVLICQSIAITSSSQCSTDLRTASPCQRQCDVDDAYWIPPNILLGLWATLCRWLECKRRNTSSEKHRCQFWEYNRTFSILNNLRRWYWSNRCNRMCVDARLVSLHVFYQWKTCRVAVEQRFAGNERLGIEVILLCSNELDRKDRRAAADWKWNFRWI